MVRRWSYLNSAKITPSLPILFKQFSIDNFKSSVYLRRFNTKITKFKRRALAKFKRRSLWSFYFNIFKNWVTDYSFFKKFVKLQFIMSFFSYSFFFFNFKELKKNPLIPFKISSFLNIFLVKKATQFGKVYFLSRVGNYQNFNLNYGTSPQPAPFLNEMVVPLNQTFNQSIYPFEQNLDLRTSPSISDLCFYKIYLISVEFYKIIIFNYLNLLQNF